MSVISKIFDTLKPSYLKKCELLKLGKHMLMGLITIAGGLLVYSILAIVLGYTPSSALHTPKWFVDELILIDKLEAFFSFLVMLCYFIFIELMLVYVVLRILTLLTENHTVLIITSGFLNFFSIVIIVVGLGYLASLDGVSSWLIAGLGLVYGVFIAPGILKAENT
jgi:hypothetical protein